MSTADNIIRHNAMAPVILQLSLVQWLLVAVLLYILKTVRQFLVLSKDRVLTNSRRFHMPSFSRQ